MKITREDFTSIKNSTTTELGKALLSILPRDWREQIQAAETYEDLMLPRCSKCGLVTDELEERQSMGIYAGKYCSEDCWKNSGYRDVGPEEFDPLYAGERLEDDY